MKTGELVSLTTLLEEFESCVLFADTESDVVFRAVYFRLSSSGEVNTNPPFFCTSLFRVVIRAPRGGNILTVLVVECLLKLADSRGCEIVYLSDLMCFGNLH